MFVDIGGVLLTNGWDHHARKRAAIHFKLPWADMDARHRLNFEIHAQGKLAFEDYLSRVVFYEKRPFTRAQFRSFMCLQQPALDIWHGEERNVLAAQRALYHRAQCNRTARRGEYSGVMEKISASHPQLDKSAA